MTTSAAQDPSDPRSLASPDDDPASSDGPPEAEPGPDPEPGPDVARPHTTQPEITCPTECSICIEPGDCEDCLDCLYWPLSVDDEPAPEPSPRGYALPTKSADLERARSELEIGRLVGLLSRRHRRQHHLSQRDLARQIGWSRAAVGRMESDASVLSLGKVERFLRFIGYRIALVPDDPDDPDFPDPAARGQQDRADHRPALDEPPDTWWGAADLLAHDRRGRRLPADADVQWHPAEELREDTTLKGREWTWRRPRDSGEAA